MYERVLAWCALDLLAHTILIASKPEQRQEGEEGPRGSWRVVHSISASLPTPPSFSYSPLPLREATRAARAKPPTRSRGRRRLSIPWVVVSLSSSVSEISPVGVRDLRPLELGRSERKRRPQKRSCSLASGAVRLLI